MFVALVLLAVSQVAQAKDVSALQAGVEYARGLVDKAQVTHKDNLINVTYSEKQLAEVQKRLEDAKKKLETDKKNANLSKLQLDEANAKLTKAQNLLDEAWKK
jgi:hypothetical protein